MLAININVTYRQPKHVPTPEPHDPPSPQSPVHSSSNQVSLGPVSPSCSASGPLQHFDFFRIYLDHCKYRCTGFSDFTVDCLSIQLTA